MADFIIDLGKDGRENGLDLVFGGKIKDILKKAI